MLSLLAHHDYHRPTLVRLLGDALGASGLLQRIRARGPRVLLKPNFVMPAPASDPSTTHPDFYMALAEVLQDAGLQVGIGESPAFGSCAAALAAHGVLDECRRRGIQVVEFRRSRAIAGVAGERHYATLSIAAELDDWDAVINVPKLKTHRQFVFTGATKNLYGCVVGKRKFLRHNLCGNDPLRFARMILAGARAVDCVAHVGDGITAMHVLGPRGGQPFPLGAVLLADDPLVLDWAQCWLTALPPESTPLFRATGPQALDHLAADCLAPLQASSLRPATDFRHAPLIHVSFSPWAVARSGWRTLRYRLDALTGRAAA